MKLRRWVERYWALPLLAVGAFAYYHRFARDPAGMLQFPAAGQCMLDNLPLQQCDPTFTYPPFFAFVMVPFAPLSMPARNMIWYCITLGAITLSFALCDVLAKRIVPSLWSDRELALARGMTFLLGLKFILAVLENQSYDAVVLLFVVCGIVALVARHEIAGGTSFAIAAALKMTPLLFLPYLLVKRRYVAAAAMTIVFVGASVLPDVMFVPTGSQYGYLDAWVHQVGGPALFEKMHGIPHAFWFATNPNNSSLRGILGMFFDEYVNPYPFQPFLYLLYAIYVAAIAALIWKARMFKSLPIDGSIVVISMLMLSPMTSRSHCIALLLPYAVLSAVFVKDRKSRLVGGAVLGTSFVLATLSSNDLAGHAISEWSGHYRLLTFGILILLAYFAHIVRPGLATESAVLRH